MTKTEMIEKLNNRYGLSYTDYFAFLTWLRRSAERCERKGALYTESAKHYREDYVALLKAE